MHSVVGSVICINRQSSRSNSRGHTAKIAAMKGTDVEAEIPHKPEAYTFVGSGSLKELEKHNFFDNPDKLPKGCYFAWLRKVIIKELQNIPSGMKLLVKVHSLDRLFRPLPFDAKKPETWEYTEEDHDMFDRYVNTCFGDWAKDIVFVPLNKGTALDIRRLQSAIGQENGKGGRPSTIQKSYRVKPFLNDKAVELAKNNKWNARQIADYFYQRHKRRITDRAIRGWLQEAGVAAPKGRPRGKKRKVANHRFNHTLDKHAITESSKQ